MVPYSLFSPQHQPNLQSKGARVITNRMYFASGRAERKKSMDKGFMPILLRSELHVLSVWGKEQTASWVLAGLTPIISAFGRPEDGKLKVSLDYIVKAGLKS